jgi:hypothetical protein
MRMLYQLFIWMGSVLLPGCSSLLPTSTSNTQAMFNSFEEAQTAALRIVPQQTRPQELKDLGFDFQSGSNVTLIAYPEIVARLAPYPGVPIDKLDAGIRQCIEAQVECRGYIFRFDHQRRRREGDFWLDFLNIRRTTHITGWWFESLVVVKSDLVLFRNIAGQANIDRVERQSNPLGPFQPAGEQAGSLLIR